MESIAFDTHKRYTLASVQADDGRIVREQRIDHHPGALRAFLTPYAAGTPVALETIGHWYWVVDEIEAAGCVPYLVNARKAKLMLGNLNKTDTLDARGLNRLQRAGTLPTVWIPPAPLRDQRELFRTRMVLVRERTRIKNRIHATLTKYALHDFPVRDIFGRRGRRLLDERLPRLPAHTGFTTRQLVEHLDALHTRIATIEGRLQRSFTPLPDVQLLLSMPGVGPWLATVMVLEIGDIRRFPRPEQLAAYAGTTPRVHASGDKTRYGPLRSDVNRYLKWAFIEAANVIVAHRTRLRHRHVSRRYDRIARRRGHARAIVAVARHLAEAAYWMLSRREPYREPAVTAVSSTGGQARSSHESGRLSRMTATSPGHNHHAAPDGEDMAPTKRSIALTSRPRTTTFRRARNDTARGGGPRRCQWSAQRRRNSRPDRSQGYTDA